MSCSECWGCSAAEASLSGSFFFDFPERKCFPFQRQTIRNGSSEWEELKLELLATKVTAHWTLTEETGMSPTCLYLCFSSIEQVSWIIDTENFHNQCFKKITSLYLKTATSPDTFISKSDCSGNHRSRPDRWDHAACFSSNTLHYCPFLEHTSLTV